MAEMFRNNPIVVRQTILYEFFKGEPIYKAYQEFCKSLGDDFIIYPDFEYWWMRFARGEFDLNHDRTLDPKCRTFTDLPEEVFNGISSNLSSNERYILRNVSKNIRRVVDSWKPDIVKMCFDYNMPEDERRKFVCFLRNPKLELDSLEVSYSDDQSAKMIEYVLKEVKHQIRVETFVVKPEMQGIAALIPKLDPNTLKHVDISINDESIDNMKRFIELEQIKGLNSLVINTNLIASEFPLKCFYDYPNFNIQFHVTDDLKPIILFVRKLIKKDTNLRRCKINYSYHAHCDKLFRKVFSWLGPLVSARRHIRQIPIPDTNDVYELEYSRFGITVVRKEKKESSDVISESDIHSDSSYDTDDYSDVDSDLSD